LTAIVERGPRCRLAVALLVAVAGCGGSDGGGRDTAGSGSSARVEVGAPTPAYATVTLDGDSVSLAGHRGRPVLLNVWATWCHPCRDEIPELQAIHERYASRGLVVAGVSVDSDGNDEAIRAFVKEFRMTYPVWRDPDERVSARFLVVGVPTTVLIDRDGILRWRRTGPVPPGDTVLIAAIERALGG
jgi:cytochrome c biogenesis protein CcmG/thiol:disulfide interchange protein DsbE